MLASEALGAGRMTETRQRMVTVAESGSGPYSQLVHAGRHVLSADEPEASGGHDVGPSPYEYLLAGLGACTAMTLRSYVERHNWGLRRMTVELWHETRRAADGKSVIDHFHRAIHFDGDLTQEQRLRLLEIAERCPVSRTLRSSSVIVSPLGGCCPGHCGIGAPWVHRTATVTRKGRS
jgi:putative redox protein